MVAGCILVIGLGALATMTGYMIGMFKLRYPHVHNMADAGYILGGPIGREILGGAQVIFLVFICGSHVLTGLIAFDTITAGASCSVLWAGVSALICLVLTIPRTLNGISYLSVGSFISILSTYATPTIISCYLSFFSCRSHNHDWCRHHWTSSPR